jgi:hypothetical protein
MSGPLCLIATVLEAEADARRVFEALDAAGYVCVPRHPTPEMIDAGWAPAHMEDAKET